MATTNCYRVIWHEEVGGKQVGEIRHDYVQASASDFTTLYGVIVTNQTKLKGPGSPTFVIDNIINIGPGNSTIGQ